MLLTLSAKSPALSSEPMGGKEGGRERERERERERGLQVEGELCKGKHS